MIIESLTPALGTRPTGFAVSSDLDDSDFGDISYVSFAHS